MTSSLTQDPLFEPLCRDKDWVSLGTYVAKEICDTTLSDYPVCLHVTLRLLCLLRKSTALDIWSCLRLVKACQTALKGYCHEVATANSKQPWLLIVLNDALVSWPGSLFYAPITDAWYDALEQPATTTFVIDVRQIVLERTESAGG